MYQLTIKHKHLC